MSENSVADKTIKDLKSRLKSAVISRTELENEFSAQSALLTGFIGKLSQACKGTDILLDNKLANLRSTLKTATSFTDFEKDIKTISTLLRQYSLKNDKNRIEIHDQLSNSSTGLQKSKNFPKESRRQLQTLINKAEEGHASLIQYIPLMSEIIAFYESIIHSQIKLAVDQSQTTDTSKPVALDKINHVEVKAELESNTVAIQQEAPKELLGRFSSILNTLVISKKHKANVSKIKSSLHGQISNQNLMTECLNVFDFMIEDLEQERSRAKVFLSTISETLTSVQMSVTATIATSSESNDQHAAINLELTEKIKEVSIGINDAGSLTEMKVDVNDKIQQIAKTLQNKAELENSQNIELNEKLNSMSAKVEKLEQQSKIFEKRIQEVQAKSFQDALTKLANRASFDEFFAKELVRFHHKQFDLAITVIDLDDFKRINDTFGHTAGDKTLQVIADTLTKVMGNDVFISRYGGEEFVLIFKDVDKITVMNRLNMLRKKVASLPFTFKGTRVTITLSIGITLVQRDDIVHSAFERADTALYRAKHEGKNKVVYG
ncbi:GGDEF domain-containing protein [Colwellia sp. 6M3]|jgi:diguanylate cyclase (GGDEF)-like protein|uniref:GGDEF domain-containing protein n=1 Tax=Colwellia sp. 6M3 TaxID=2759849 RepID=UPI0015F5CD66|nr:GGDEF domain-containing protein [Colwellia sp. 6M3]MBA6415991.1 GGDEF domain-containing protein [Colwellia sp. 6M3]